MKRIWPVVLLIAGCGDNSKTTEFSVASVAFEPPADRSGASYLALGDSYTIGEAVDEADRFPEILAASLRKSGHKVAKPYIVARTGWTTAELLAGIEKSKFQPPYDLVTVLIGVNNQYRGRSIDEYRTEFKTVLEKAISFAGDRPDRVIVVSIPDWGVTQDPVRVKRDEVAAAIDRFNAVNREESEKAKVAYVDITPVSRTAAADKEMVATDGLHFSGKMHAKWVELIEAPAASILKKK